MSSISCVLFHFRFSLEDSPRKQAECLVAVSTGLKSLSHTMQGLVSMDYSDSVVEVAGLLLPRLQGETTTVSKKTQIGTSGSSSTAESPIKPVVTTTNIPCIVNRIGLQECMLS